MDRFEDAKIGDLVYCRLRGDGVITSVTYSERYMLECFFGDNTYAAYDYSGRSSKDHVEPTLFYRKGEERYLEKRPEIEVDWSKVPIGTKIKVNDEKELENKRVQIFMGYFPELERPFWGFDDNYRDTATGFKYCKLAEPCKPEWIKR